VPRHAPGGADLGVRALEHDVVDTEHVAGDLGGDRDETLADLGRCELQMHHAVGEPAAGGRVIVEALGVHEVLHRRPVADAAHHVAGVGGAPRPAGQPDRVAVGAADRLVGERQRFGLAQAALHRRHVAQHLTRDQSVAGADGVAHTHLDRVEAACLGEQVEL
jgi:hypothetical protein